MLEGCKIFALSEMVQELVERSGGTPAAVAEAWDRVMESLQIIDLDADCTGRPLTALEATDARVAVPAVAFRLNRDSGKEKAKADWFLCSMEPVKTSAGTGCVVCIVSYVERQRISSPFWLDANKGKDPNEYLAKPDAHMLRCRPSIKDFFDGKTRV